MDSNKLAGPLVIVIASLVAVALWYAKATEEQEWSRSDSDAGATIEPLSPPVAICDARWVEGSVIALGTLGTGGPLFLHDAEQASTRRLIDAGAGTVSSARLSADGCHVLAGTYDGRLWWIDLESTEMPRKLIDLFRTTRFSATAIADDGGSIAAGTVAGSIYVCDPGTGTSRGLSFGRESIVTDLHFSRDRKRLASSHQDGSLHIWDLTTGERLPEFARHDGRASAVAFLPDGERLISVGLDDTVRVWDIAREQETWHQEAGMLGVTALAVSPDGSTAAWGGFDHTIVLWSLDRGQLELEIDTPNPQVTHLKFSPDGNTLAVTGNEATIRRYDARTGLEQKALEVGPP